MRVKPAPGLQVRDPATLELIPAEGVDFDPTNLIHVRLFNDGDLVDANPGKAPAKTQGA